MTKRIAVVDLGPDDFLTAPAWAGEMLKTYSQSQIWHIQVFHELRDDDSIEQMVDLQVGDTSYLYGPLPMLLRHVARSNLATIARGSMMGMTEHGWSPLHDNSGNLKALRVLCEGLPQEAAWLMELQVDTVMSMAALKEWTPERLLTICETLEPECTKRWANNHQQAITAVALL